MWHFLNLFFSSWDIKFKKTTGFYLQTETTFFLFFRDLMNYKEVLKLQASFFQRKMSSWLSYCQFFFFFKKGAGFSVLVNLSVKYASLMKIKHYSVLKTLLQDIGAKTGFKKRRTFNVFTVGNISVHSVAYCWATN